MGPETKSLYSVKIGNFKYSTASLIVKNWKAMCLIFQELGQPRNQDGVTSYCEPG